MLHFAVSAGDEGDVLVRNGHDPLHRNLPHRFAIVDEDLNRRRQTGTQLPDPFHVVGQVNLGVVFTQV